MNTAPLPSLTPHDVVRLLVTKWKLWAIPAVACGALAAAYSLVSPRYWEASQALVVRQDTAGAQGPVPGKFADLFEMRTLQETILELAKSQQVVVSTIKAVDERMLGYAAEPTAEEIDEFRQRLKMLPPDGGEFGKTEVFYFYVKDRSRLRAMELVGELCRQLDIGLKELRVTRAGSLIAELQEQVKLATEIHTQETDRLKEFESQVGADLGELRMLHSASSGQSDLRQEAVQLEADVRKFESQMRESEQLLGMLRAAEKDPLQLIATPNSLLVSQPALRRLKDGLVDAQLATARLGGTRSADHPRVKAAIEGEKHIRNDLHRELVTAIRGAEAEVSLGQSRVAATRSQLAGVELRLGRLASQRAEYSNRVAAVENSRITLDRARQNFSTAKAAQAAARTGSLVTRLDEPETGPYPAGPGRTVIAGAGVAGGLMLGLGLVFLTAGPVEQARSDSPSLLGTMKSALAGDVKPSLVAKRPVTPESVGSLWPASMDAGASKPERVSPKRETQPAAASSGVNSEPAYEPSTSVAVAEAPPAVVAEARPAMPAVTVKLPSRKTALPVAAGGLSLQEALKAARELQL
jgi:polysaccharide biosynthesis transport protein